MKQVESLVDHWVKEMGAEIIALEETLVALANLKLKDPPSDDDKKQMKKLEEKIPKHEQNIEGINLALKVSMMGISRDYEVVDSPKKLDLTKKFPGWLKTLIEKKGVSVGKKMKFTIAPTIKFDMKKKQVNDIGIKVTW
jgi:hypothetical protein